MTKYKKQIKTLLFLFFFIGCLGTNAQDKFTIKCLLTKDGITLDSTNAPFRIDLIDQDYSVYHLKSINPFLCELDINCTYQFVFYYPDCQPKRISIDTHSPGVYNFLYTFSVNLNTSLNEEPHYAGGIFYNEKTTNFDFYKN